MQALPEVTPRKEPTEITGSLFAVVVVIPLNYPRANECSRTTREQPHSGHVPGCQEEIRGFIKAYSHPFPAELNPSETQPKSRNAAALVKSAAAFQKLIMQATP